MKAFDATQQSIAFCIAAIPVFPYMFSKKQGYPMPKPKDSNKVRKEIEKLERQIAKISNDLKKMKAKVVRGDKIRLEDLHLTVRNIASLDTVMRERQDVGH